MLRRLVRRTLRCANKLPATHRLTGCQGRGCARSEASTERRVGRWGLGRSGT